MVARILHSFEVNNFNDDVQNQAIDDHEDRQGGLWSLIAVILITPLHIVNMQMMLHISYSGFSLSSQTPDLCSTEEVRV